jgi:hypothetical protein
MSIIRKGEHRASSHRLRNYLLIFVAAAIAAGLGVASAAWWSIPQGNGHAYGHGKNGQQGVAITSLDWSTDGSGHVDSDIGPSESGFVWIGFVNNNAVPVKVTAVSLASGGQITVPGDPTCTASSPADFTLGALTAPVQLPANNSTAYGGVPITTTATLPGCLAGVRFTLPVTITASAS